jgi:hypothetical protein
MSKRNNEKLEVELKYKKEWCLTILNFMLEKYGNTTLFLNQMKEVVNEIYNTRNYRGMGYCYKDINEWAKSLPLSDVQKLDSALKDKFGEGLQKQHEKDNTKIDSIIKIGRIANEDEYRLILNYVDEISINKFRTKEAEILNRLIVEFISR